jgi:primosomal protein N'
MFDGISVGGLLWRLRCLLVGERRGHRQYECRHCGYSSAKPRQHCPECGAAEMVRYEF